MQPSYKLLSLQLPGRCSGVRVGKGVGIANPYPTGIRTRSVNGTYLRRRSGGQEPETG